MQAQVLPQEGAMPECTHFTGEWRIIQVDDYDETVGHVIVISELPDGQFQVQCPGHKDYPKSTCVDGTLQGDDGYTIQYITEPLKKKIHFTAGALPSGSWTAEDNR